VSSPPPEDGRTALVAAARRSHHPGLYRRTPARADDWFDADELAQARAYTRPLNRLRLVQGGLSVAVLVAFIWLEGGRRVIDALGVGNWVVALIAVAVALQLLDLLVDPWFSAYVELGYDKRWGLSTQTPRQWVIDQVKNLIVGSVLFSALFIPVYAFIRSTDRWWFYGWLAFMAVQIFFAFVYPVVIMPVFNKFTPLEDGELRHRIDGVAARAETTIEGAYTMDASRRSVRDNAFVAGFGPSKRVVVFDTMLEHPPELVEQVVAHEIGHYRLRHIPKTLPVAALLTLATFGFLKVFTEWDLVLDWAGVESVGDPAALPVLLLGFGAASKVTGLVSAWYSRTKERQADLEALELLGDPEGFIDVWRRMAPKNKAELEPSWWKRLNASHPPVAERMAFGRRWAELNPAAPPSA
jgi:STE24 endopeptidase